MKKILLAITLSFACYATAHADGVVHMPDGDIRYTTEQIGNDVWVTYYKDGEQLKKQHYNIEPDGTWRLLGEE